MLTAAGFVCIESIKEGDEVYSCNADTGEIGLKKVQKTYVHEVTELVHLTIDDETIDTTREHPFFLEGLGFIAASELRPGDEIRLYDGSTGVVKSVEIETLKNPVNVYNFEVEDWHTYYVGEEGALVHNSCSNKKLSAEKQKAVRKAWKQEKELVEKTGQGTREWTIEEKQELLKTGRVKGYEGQHMKSAAAFPEYAGDPNNIQFLKGRNMDINEHLEAHMGNYSNITNWYYDPKTGVYIDFGEYMPH